MESKTLDRTWWLAAVRVINPASSVLVAGTLATLKWPNLTMNAFFSKIVYLISTGKFDFNQLFDAIKMCCHDWQLRLTRDW